MKSLTQLISSGPIIKTENPFFPSIGLQEPKKSDVLGKKTIPRVIELTGVDEEQDGGFVALIDVTGSKVLSSTRLPLDTQVAYNYADLGLAVHSYKVQCSVARICGG
jgi:hypothetical protein